MALKSDSPTERWTQVAAVVEAALGLERQARPDYVRSACGRDSDMVRQVESLLLHHEQEEALRTLDTGVSTVQRPPVAAPWAHARFEQPEWLGSGGFGDVYKAWDRILRRTVAVKVLRTVDADRLDRFKKEFRQTATMTHHNIVQLHELFSDGERWFFTMELVDGVSILDHVRGRKPWAPGSLTGAQWQRLHQAFHQLAEGVCALHAAGMVHGDLKPQNVLVTPEGRVVLLDFGLLRELSQQPSLVAGTPAYMAPEQLSQAPAAGAADWYAFGVLLYKALTTRVPFDGSCWEILWKKLNEDVTLPEADDVPDHILSLCEALLRREPAKRPCGEDIRARLAPRSFDHAAASHQETALPLVGRRDQLRLLRDAFDAIANGPVAVHLRGPSGIGKTALVRHFADTLRHEREDAVILAGRCHEAESIPFKALDELVDELSRYLCRLSPADLDAVLPTHLSLLQRVFPTLRRIERGARPPLPSPLAPGQELRDRALGALRELLERLAERRPVVLWIDDLQWGDLDSVRILHELQHPSSAPRLLLILSYRSEDTGVSPVLQAVMESARQADAAGTIREVVLGELRRDEALQLVTAVCDELPEEESAAVVAEAGGNPLFLQELARQAATQSGPVRRAPDLLGTIQRRVQALHPTPRRLLEVIAVAAQPLLREVAFHAAALEGADAESSLVAGFLVRASRSTAGRVLDTYHHKVREAVVGLMAPDERRACHERLARALEAEGHTDPERFVQHFTKAGIEREAYRCAVAAARTAEDSLAFDRAASLLRLAVDLDARLPSPAATRDVADPTPGGLWQRLARALANAGRSAEAADAYARAAEMAGDAAASELRAQAVDQLMRSGQVDDGLNLLTTTLRGRGMRIPRTRTTLVAATVATRLWLRVRGLRFRERPADQVPAPLLGRIDTLWTAGATLTVIDPLLSAFLRAHHLRLALRAGEATRLSMGLALEAVQRVLADPDGYPRARQLLDRSRELAARCGDPHAEAMTLTAEAGTAYFCGRMGDAFRHAVQAEDILESRCIGVAWELAATRIWSLSALSYSGRWKEYTARLDAVLRAAERNGDRYAQCALPLSTGCYGIHLAADRPEAARRVLDEKIALWRRPALDYPRLGHWKGTVETLLYEQHYEEAWQTVSTMWALWRHSLVLHVHLARFLAEMLRARCALGLHSVSPDPSLLGVAERFVRWSTRSSAVLVQGWGLLIDAAMKVSAGQRERAVAKLQLAEQRLDEVGALQVVAVSVRRRGELIGGTEGSRLVRLADQQFLDLGVTNPARMTARFLPGHFSSSP